MTTTLNALAGLLCVGLYRPPLALGFVTIALLIVLAIGVAAARRERLWWPLGLRAIAIASLGWVLLGYSLTQPGRPADITKPTLTILIDRSASMAEQDVFVTRGTAAVSRLKAVSDAYLSDEVLRKLRSVSAVELLPFDDQLWPDSPYGLEPMGESTALYEAISSIDSDAALLLSDGHDTTHRGEQKPAAANGRLFAVPVGTPRASADLALQAWPESDRLFEDQATTITALIRQSGFTGRQAKVDLLHEGEPIQSRTITLGQKSKPIRFSVTPPLAVGQAVQSNHYTATVRLAQHDESYLDNNTEDIFIQTTQGQIRVLLLEGEPYWDTRSLSRLITGHPRFDLTARFAFGTARRVEQIGETIGRGADPIQQLDTFDVVILGREVQRLVDPGFAERLSEYVKRGGAVVFARGQPIGSGADAAKLQAAMTPISPVSWGRPVVEEMRVRLVPISDGQRGPLAGLGEGELLTRLPGMLAATRIDGRKAASLIMLEQASEDSPPMAALTSLRVGSGISMAVLTEGLWRWELLPGVDAEDRHARNIYAALWVRALQWLASGGSFLPGQDISLQADHLTAEPDQPINLQIRTRYIETDRLDLQLTATHRNGTTTPITPSLSDPSGTYTASFTPNETGVYTVSLTAPGRDDLIDPGRPLTTRLAVIDRSAERRDTSAKPDVLMQLVEPTGGQCLPLGEVQPVLDYLQSLQALRGSQDTVDYAFDRWPVFALIAGCFGLEWILRRRMGLR